MKKSKRFLSLLLVCCLVVMAFPLAASAEVLEGSCGEDVTWVLDTSTGTLTISGTGPMNDWTYYNDVPWVNYRQSIKKIVVNSGVTYIGRCAFNMWATSTQLTSVSLPDTVTSIGSFAFQLCSKLETVNLHDGITTIGESAFTGCESLKLTRLPSSLTSLGSYAFHDCASIGPTLVIPEGVTAISGYAFCGCSGVTSLTIHEGVTAIGGYAFSETSIQKLVVPSTVGKIGDCAFSDIKTLLHADLQGGTSLGYLTFSGCSSLVKITFQKLVTLGTWMGMNFYGCDSLEYLYFPACTTEINEINCKNLKTVCIVNPECDISTNEIGTVGQTTIYGESDSTAKAFAVKYGYAFKLLGTQPDEPEDPVITQFTDVPWNAYYSRAVAWAVENNITSGTTDTTFSPDAGCTRAQAVSFLWRAAGRPEPAASSNPFSDVDSGDYYYKAVLWAVQNGITAGTSSNTFSPDSTCLRSQIVSFLYRYAGKPAVGGSNSFSDVSSGSYYYSAVQWAVNNGITSGTGNGKFSPNNTCTRAQIVSFLYRYIV